MLLTCLEILPNIPLSNVKETDVKSIFTIINPVLTVISRFFILCCKLDWNNVLNAFYAEEMKLDVSFNRDRFAFKLLRMADSLYKGLLQSKV